MVVMDSGLARFAPAPGMTIWGLSIAVPARLNAPQIMPILAVDRTAHRRTAKNGAPQGPLKVASRGLCDVSCSFVIQSVPVGIRRNRACARSRRQGCRRLPALQYRALRP